jgi:hypothetical protein
MAFTTRRLYERPGPPYPPDDDTEEEEEQED